MKLIMHFLLAAAAACGLVTSARSQSYSGASSSDLLGYRSSAGNYYNRSFGSKVQLQVKRRAPQKKPTAGTTTFRPVAPMLAPKQLAAKAKKDVKELERFYTELLEEYEQILRNKGLPQNDVARAASFAAAVSHDVYGDDLSESQLKGLREQMREVFVGDEEFQRLSDREKQELYESYAILGMYLSGAKALKVENQTVMVEMRRIARAHLEETFNAPVGELVFTDSGVKYR